MNNSLLVKFPNVGVISISRKTWCRYNRNGQVQGFRTQYPLSLSYAITVHKAQSTMLESAVVHCSQEFECWSNRSVIKSQVRKKSSSNRFPEMIFAKTTDAYQGNSQRTTLPVSSFTCCRNEAVDSANCELDRDDDPSLITDENSTLIDEDLLTHKELIRRCFASNQGQKQDFKQILQHMTNFENDEEPQHPLLTQPPHNFNVQYFLEKLVNDENVDSLTRTVKEAAQYAITNLEIFEMLTRVLWCRVFHLFDGYLSDNTNKVHMSAANITEITRKLSELFLTNEYRSDIMTAFNLCLCSYASSMNCQIQI